MDVNPKVCVMCGKPVPGKRKDTCSDACRAKLFRMRQKARSENAITAEERLEMEFLSKQIPGAAMSLWKLRAIYGKESYELAMDAVRRVGLFFQGEGQAVEVASERRTA